MEHVESDPYDDYFTSAETFGTIEAADDRLPPKEPVFAFRVGGEPWAIPHSAFEGGRVVDLPWDDRSSSCTAPPAPPSTSSEAWLVEPATAEEGPAAAALLAAARAGGAGFSRVEGFDTFWYTWVGVNAGTGLLP